MQIILTEHYRAHIAAWKARWVEVCISSKRLILPEVIHDIPLVLLVGAAGVRDRADVPGEHILCVEIVQEVPIIAICCTPHGHGGRRAFPCRP